MTNHTPTPWRVQLETESTLGGLTEHTVRRIYSSNADVPGSRYVAEVQPYATSPEADAHRIVSCVNALAGIEEPEVAMQTAREILAAIVANCDGTHAPALPGFMDAKVRDALKALGG